MKSVKKVLTAGTVACFAMIMVSVSCKKDAGNDSVPSSKDSKAMNIARDTSFDKTVVKPEPQVVLAGGRMAIGAKSCTVLNTNFTLAFYGGIDRYSVTNAYLYIEALDNPSDNYTLSVHPYINAVANGDQPSGVTLAANKTYYIQLIADVASSVPEKSSVSANIFIGWTDDQAMKGFGAQKTVFSNAIASSGSLSVAVTVNGTTNAIIAGAATQTLAGTFTAANTAIKIQSLRVSVADSSNVASISLRVSNVLQSTVAGTGIMQFATPISVAVASPVQFAIVITTKAGVVGTSMLTSISGIAYVDAVGNDDIVLGSYGGDMYIAVAQPPTISLMPQTNQYLTDNAFRSLYAFSLSAGRYKQLVIAFRFADQLGATVDSMSIDSLQISVGGIAQKVGFTVRGTNRNYITKNDSLAYVTFSSGVGELVVQNSATLILSGRPRKFGVGNGNGVVLQLVTDASPAPIGSGRLFKDGSVGGSAIGLGASAGSVTSSLLIWSTGSIGGHSALAGQSSNDWSNGWGIAPVGTQTLLTN